MRLNIWRNENYKKDNNIYKINNRFFMLIKIFIKKKKIIIIYNY